jgi:hypothetical protein
MADTVSLEALKSGVGLWNQMTGAIDDYISRQKDAGHSVGYIATQTALLSEPLTGIIGKNVTGMGKFGEAGKVAGTTINEAFEALTPTLERVMSKSQIGALGRFTTITDNAYQLQRGLISLAAAQGQLSSMFDVGTKSFKNIDQAMTQMSDSAYESAVATGQSVGAMMDLAERLGPIPGALTDVVQINGLFSSQLVVTSQIAAAFGQSQTEVAKRLGTMYEYMGLKGTESMEVISRLYAAAGDSKIRFEGFSKSVMEIAQNFKMLGDNTDATITVVKAFDTAFRDSDISPAAIQQVITSMTSGIREMDRGRQAFISGATGGPGGLAGAFQIELALQEGRMDEVLQKTMTAMQQQFGGQVLTLKDAASNPALAGEFHKQVQYLTSVAGVAKDDREAFRILEAMQSGVMDMLAPGAPGMPAEGPEALRAATERGAAEQQRTTSAVVRVEQVLERKRLMQSELLGQINTRINESLGIPDRMSGAVGASSALGVQNLGTTEAFRRTVAPMTTEERIQGVLTEIQGVLTEAGLTSMFGAARAPTAGVSVPGMTARAPMGPSSIIATPPGGAARSPFAENGTFPTIPITVDHSQIKVSVELSEPFDRAVTTIVQREIQDFRATQRRQADTGT